MTRTSTLIFVLISCLGGCGTSGPIGPTPSIPGIPGHWGATEHVTLAIEVPNDDPLDGFAQSANPLQFRSQTVKNIDSSVEQIPDERARDAGRDIAAAPPEDYERVVGRVRGTYLTRLERCFGSGPGRAGKLHLAFTVAESGEVREASVTGLDAGINACVKKRVMRWSFATERDGSGDASIVLSVVVM